MSQPFTVILSSGDMPSLVTTAIHAELRLALLFIHDGRPSAEHRHQSFLQQAETYHIAKRHELVMPHLAAASGAVDVHQAAPRAPMADAQMLAAALGFAAQFKADRLIWPHQVGEDFAAIARVTETVSALAHLCRIETERDIVVETPLLETTDRQLVEIGHQIDAPWQLARSCDGARVEPCGECHGCRRRYEAFRAAGLEDPLLAHH